MNQDLHERRTQRQPYEDPIADHAHYLHDGIVGWCLHPFCDKNMKFSRKAQSGNVAYHHSPVYKH